MHQIVSKLWYTENGDLLYLGLLLYTNNIVCNAMEYAASVAIKLQALVNMYRQHVEQHCLSKWYRGIGHKLPVAILVEH